MARVVFVTSGLEHLGVAALSAAARAAGHEPALVYEPQPFSSNSGTDSPLLARLIEPSPAQTAARILAHAPDVVAFSSYTITHRWAVHVARAVKRARAVPVVFGGPHVSGAPEHSIREPAIDAVVEGEGEGALIDLLACAEGGRFARTDVPNTWVRGPDGAVVRNELRPLIEDLDALPWADKSGFYGQVPAFEREVYVISRRGCPYRCSFCEYSIFPRQYPGEKPVRRRSVEHFVGELAYWKSRGVVRKFFFWDAIFTLDTRWMAEFAARYAREVGLPFECYSHPQAMTREMARLLAAANCAMVRVGVQSVNADTLAAMDRKGDAERVAQTIGYLRDAAVPYALDHIIGLPGEGADDQRAAVRFYNEVRPRRIYVHWMTYLPGTTALERARTEGILTPAQVEAVLTGAQTEGYEAPRLVAPGEHRDELAEIERLAVLFDLISVLPRGAIAWLLESGAYRALPRAMVLRKLVELALAVVGDTALRERLRTIVMGAAQSAAQSVARAAAGERAADWLRRAFTPDEGTAPPPPPSTAPAAPSRSGTTRPREGGAKRVALPRYPA